MAESRDTAMIDRTPAAGTRHFFCLGLFLLLPLFATPAGWAQQDPQGLAVWEPSAARMQPMLAKPPTKREDRYARLRQYFTAFGCTGEHLADAVLARDTRHPALLCTLPGASLRTILVVASYERDDFFQEASDGWPEAVLLPMLYHALQAQPHRNTYLFAELGGHDSLERLVAQHRSEKGSLPLVLVSVVRLGFGPPAFSTVPNNTQPQQVRPNNDVVRIEAWRLLHLQHIEAGASSPSAPIPWFIAPVEKGVPSIVVYSNPVALPGHDPEFSLSAFRQDYDFVAFYLDDLDLRLNGSL